MRAVWSHWTKPLKDHPGSTWKSIKHYLLSFVLSFENARRYFSPTCLYTDKEGFHLLVEAIGIPFDLVSTELEVLNDYCLYWWNMGKFYTYGEQTGPFVHLDNDVFIWEALPERVTSAPLFAQNPEYFTESSDYYLPVELERALTDGWLPDEWVWGRNVFRNFQKAFNTGIYGGNRTDFVRYCAKLSMDIITHPDNAEKLVPIDNKAKISGMVEMYVPSICYDYHKNNDASQFNDIEFEHLFSSAEEAYTNPSNIKYTHILGKAKRDESIIKRLDDRVNRLYPHYHERIEEYVREFGELCKVLEKSENDCEMRKWIK